MRVLVVCPHFEPDTAPTGAVMSRIVAELGELGHEVHVVTALPWYRLHRIESEWAHTTWSRRTSEVSWGSITRLNPFPGTDKRNIVRRALGFLGFTVLAMVAATLVARRQKIDIVLAMSPPLTLGIAARVAALSRRAPMVLNIQDVFPDAAIRTGVITNRFVIRAARVLETLTYRLSRIITVLSDDLRDNVCAKLPERVHHRVEVIPNFVDCAAIVPGNRATAYRSELRLGDGFVVMYAGNVGYSQSLELLVEAARALPGITFVINGSGSARAELENLAHGLPNLVFGEFQPASRLAEVLCTADLHVVPLRTGLGHVSVPSKTYSILAAGRPILASIDVDTEVPRLLERSGAGVVVTPDDAGAFVEAVRSLASDRQALDDMGRRGRDFVVSSASPRVVAERYVETFRRAIA